MQVFIHRNRVLFLHLFFWFIYLSFIVYQMLFFQRERGYDWSRLLTYTTIQLGFTLTIVYLNYFVFLPRFLSHKNPLRYVAEFVIPFTVLIIARIYLQRYMMEGSPRYEYFSSMMYVVQVTAVTLFIVIFVGLLRFAVEWFEMEARKKEMENEKLIAELNFLKAQINPHFLFNTLNNLYYLAYSKSDNTTEVIAKLSQMMRYMIYESNHPKVLLTKEMEYMKNYISLEQMRLNNQIPIQFDVRGQLENVWIAPLIFITFLENAFKHGVSSNLPNAWIKVVVDLNGKECVYRVENSKARVEGSEKTGIGLQNVKRRLELSYPDQYQLFVNENEDQYSVQLNLTLN